MAIVLTIDGITRDWHAGTLRIRETANGRNTLTLDVISTDASWRPVPGDEILITDTGTRIFGGLIDDPEEYGLVGYGHLGEIRTTVRAIDFNSYADRRYVTATIPTGTLKAALQVLDDYLTPYGVTLDAAQVNGPTLSELVYDTRKLSDIFNELAALSGYQWEIDYTKVLRMTSPGSVTAPFNVVPVSDDHAIGDIVVERKRSDYANRVIVAAGTGDALTTDTFVGNGVTREFQLTVPATSYTTAFENGAYVHVAAYDDTGYLFEWVYRPSDYKIIQLAEAPPGVFNNVLTAGDTLEVQYSGRYPFHVQADDAAEQALYGLVEVVIAAPEVFDATVAQALADSYLAQATATVTRVRYTTRETGIHPGQAQTITVTTRNLSGTHLITDVEVFDVGGALHRRVTAIAGTVYPGSWRDDFRQIVSGTSMTGIVISGSGGGSGGGGLGGSGTVGTLAKWTSGSTLGNSIVTESGTTVTVAGTLAATTLVGAITLTDNSVTLAKLAQIATGTVLGRSTAGTGNVEVLTTLPTAIQDAMTRLGTITQGVWQGTDIGLAYGGTNATLTASAGAIVYSGASALALTAAGSTGQILQSAGTGTPVWSTATYPDSAVTTGTYLRADGGNWIASTLKLPNAATLYRVPYATVTDQWGESANLTFNGTLLTTQTLATSFVSSDLIPSQTDTYDLGRYDRLWSQGFLSVINAIIFRETTQTLFGGYSTVGVGAGTLAADVTIGETSIDFGMTMTPGEWVLIRAHDFYGVVRAEYLLIGSLVSGTRYNVTRDLAGAF